jgi:hypothetical protein
VFICLHIAATFSFPLTLPPYSSRGSADLGLVHCELHGAAGLRRMEVGNACHAGLRQSGVGDACCAELVVRLTRIPYLGVANLDTCWSCDLPRTCCSCELLCASDLLRLRTSPHLAELRAPRGGGIYPRASSPTTLPNRIGFVPSFQLPLLTPVPAPNS